MPAAIYLFAAGSTGAGIGFTIYSIIIVSTIDNFLRPYLVSRRTKSASVVVLMGMIGGLIVFGPLGLLIGPLILEYVVLFLDAYKNKAGPNRPPKAALHFSADRRKDKKCL